jgi:hypothetical protein
MNKKYSYAGFSNVTLSVDAFELGHGLSLRPTYAHLMAPHMMAFSPAQAGKPHPPPWRAAKGGFAYDITVELAVPIGVDLPGGLSVQDTIWWIAALLRIAGHPYLPVPVISDISFSQIAGLRSEPDLHPFEITLRILHAGDPEIQKLEDDLVWIREKWSIGAKLLKDNPTFFSAVRAFDFCTVEGRRSLSLLSVWGAIEELFAPSAGELRFRVSSNIAAYLEPPGQKRFALFKEILKLYDVRSRAAHTSS